MSTIVLFHSALGLRPAVHRFADLLREKEHDVQTPDLYDGRTFDDLESGEAYRDAIGIPELTSRARSAVASLAEDIIYAGFSMGTVPAQLLAGTRPGARGALLVQGGAPLEWIGVQSWPDVPVQLHVAIDDPWFGRADAEVLVSEIGNQHVDYREYPGGGHLFFDEEWRDYDRDAAERLIAAAREWLRALDP